MLICICHGISDKKIIEMIQNGSNSADDITQKCGAGGDCGSCVMKLQKFFEEPQKEKYFSQKKD